MSPRWLRTLSRLVPPELRDEWLREWAAELAHAASTGGRARTVGLAAVEDALCMVPERIEAGAGIQDLRYAVRALRANRGFALAAVATLALGIGANTAIFSVVNGYIVRPLPLPEPERVVIVQRERAGAMSGYTSAPNYLDWRDRTATVEDLAAVQQWSANLTGTGVPLRVTRSLVTPGFFEMLGIRPALGRTFDAAEGEYGSADVVVLSHALWVDVFGADPEVLGRRVEVNGVAHTVVGVMPSGLRVPPVTAELWAPLAFTPDALDARGRNNLLAIGRLRPDATLAQARSELGRIGRDLAREHPRSNEGWDITVTGLHEFALGTSPRGLWTLLGAVALVLLLACANVANLVLARGAARERELAVRTALGATRGRLFVQLLGESVLIGLAGGALGLLVAYAALDPIRALVPDALAGVGDVTVDRRVLAYTMAVSLATGILAGMAPALRLSRGARGGPGAPAAVLRVRGSAGMVRGGLTVAQFAIATLLLSGAVLLSRSLAELGRVDLGVETEGRTTFGVTFPEASYATPQAMVAAVDGVLERLRARPGVVEATALSHLPLSGARLHSSVDLEGVPRTNDPHGPSAAIVVAAPNAFEVLGIALVRGRLFDDRDRAGTDPVVVINEAAAAAFWPEGDALGRWLSYAADTAGQPVRRRVIGIVANTRYGGPSVPAMETVFEPHRQTTDVWRWFGRSMAFVVRTGNGRVLPLSAAQEAVSAVASDLPVVGLATLDEVLDRSIATPRFHGTLGIGFAGLALVVAVIGLYGVLAFTVRRRRRELGVRLALGADRGRVIADVLKHATRLAAIGALAGSLAALALGRVLEALLWGVEPTDPLTWVVVLLTLGAATLAAALVPAWRAAAVDPAITLRLE